MDTIYMNNFMFSERNIGEESDNLIIYYAGPIKVSISGWDGYIILSTSEKWKHLLKEATQTAIIAWELDEKDIEYSEVEVKIKYSFKNLKLYIEHALIFM